MRFFIVGLLIILLWLIITFNKLVTLMNKVKESLATMDVYLKKRYDLLPNLVEVVKQYAKHERETLEQIVIARSKKEAKDVSQIQNEEKELSSTLTKLFALAENYPQLKANDTFILLQQEVSDLESEISDSRRYYNACVRQYNTRIGQFPTNVAASIFRYKEKEYFDIDEVERSAVKLEFAK